MLLRHYFRQDFDRAFEVEAFARPDAQLIGNRIQMLLAVDRQVRAFGQVLADQAVDVLVTAALPGAVRIAEIDRTSALDQGTSGDPRSPAAACGC